MKRIVGIDRKVKRIWADALLDQLAETTKEKELRSFLSSYLKEDLPSKETRAKAVGIVLKIWGTIPRERMSLRQRAIDLLPHISGQERIWLHWGMMSLAYPFFRDGVEIVGRLLALQDDFTSVQVQGRIVKVWGDRTTTKLAARYLLNTLVDWEVLRPGKKQGHFLLSRKLAPSSPKLSLWLLEALLAASESDEIEAQQLLRLPEAFPFSLKLGIADLRGYEGFNIHRQGLDMDMVAHRKLRSQPPAMPNMIHKAKPKQQSKGLFDDVLVNNGDEALSPKAKSEDALNSPTTEHFVQPSQIKFPFSAAIEECKVLFRSGYYLGCIALAQSVVESIVRQAWQATVKKSADQHGSFTKFLEALYKKSLISEDLKRGLDRIWDEQEKFDQQKRTTDSGADQVRLESDAKSIMKLLNELQDEFFGFKLKNGIAVAHHPEYWETTKQ